MTTLEELQQQQLQLQTQNEELLQSLQDLKTINARQETTQVRQDDNAVHRVGVKLPPFWPDDVELWFAQIEAQFLIAHINQETTKFAYTVSQLEGKHAHEVRDIIKNPPPDNPYSHLKKEMILRLSPSSNQRIKQILIDEEIGSRKPSQFLRHLQSLANNTGINDDLIRHLWVSRLPTQIQSIIQVQLSEQTLDQLACVADSIHEINKQVPINTVNAMGINKTATPQQSFSPISTVCATSSSSSTQSDLNSQVKELALEIEKLKQLSSFHFEHGSKGCTRFHSPNQNHSKSPISQPDDTCWYHYKFGNKAKKCNQPCNFPLNSKGSQ